MSDECECGISFVSTLWKFCPECGKPRQSPEPATYAVLHGRSDDEPLPELNAELRELLDEYDPETLVGFYWCARRDADKLVAAADAKGRREAFQEMVNWLRIREYHGLTTIGDVEGWALQQRDACGTEKATGENPLDETVNALNAEVLRLRAEITEMQGRHLKSEIDSQKELDRLRAENAKLAEALNEEGKAHCRTTEERDELRAKLLLALARQHELRQSANVIDLNQQIGRLTSELEEARQERKNEAGRILWNVAERERLERELKEARQTSQPPAKPAPVTHLERSIRFKWTPTGMQPSAQNDSSAIYLDRSYAMESALRDQAAAVEAATAPLRARVAELEEEVGGAMLSWDLCKEQCAEKDKRIAELEALNLELATQLASYKHTLAERIAELEKERDANAQEVERQRKQIADLIELRAAASRDAKANAQAARDFERVREILYPQPKGGE